MLKYAPHPTMNIPQVPDKIPIKNNNLETNFLRTFANIKLIKEKHKNKTHIIQDVNIDDNWNVTLQRYGII